MLAFELPPNDMIAVEYIGLSKHSDVSELQKDLLRQALGEILPSAREIIDASEAPAQAQSSGVYLRCVQCDVRSEKLPSSIKLIGEERTINSIGKSSNQFKLLVSGGDKSQQTWIIELGPRKTAWFASIQLENLNPQGRLEKASFQINSCLDGISCPTATIFKSKADCSVWLERFVGKRVDLAAASSLYKKDKILSVEKLPFQNDVRAQSQVRAMMSSTRSSLTIKTHARALKNGSIGDIIPVEVNMPSFSLSKSRQIEARVTGEGEVEIVR